jgi:hypothetical protein
MRHLIALLGATALLLGCAVGASAAPILIFNTGVDGSGNPLADNASEIHYSLISPSPVTGTPVVATSAGGFPIPPWLGDNSLSAWISPTADTNAPQGEYTYRTTFDLTGLDPATASLTGQWAGDNDLVAILINGVVAPQGNLPAIDPGSGTRPLNTFFPFSITTGFVPGINTLDFVVNNQPTSNNPTGVRVEVSGTAAIAQVVPEPTSLALFGAFALAGVGVCGWRRWTQRMTA